MTRNSNDFLMRRRSFLGGCCLTIGDTDVGAFLGEADCGSTADSARAASDQRILVLEPETHRYRSISGRALAGFVRGVRKLLARLHGL